MPDIDKKLDKIIDNMATKDDAKQIKEQLDQINERLDQVNKRFDQVLEAIAIVTEALILEMVNGKIRLEKQINEFKNIEDIGQKRENEK